MGDIVRQVAGDGAQIHQLLQANSDPHEYEPRPADIEAAAGAKLVIESGNGLDHWMGDVVKQAGGSPAEVTIAPDHTPNKVAGEAEGDEPASEFDPHWWHDPRNVEAAVGVVRDELAKIAPGNAETYTANADAYLTKVKALDTGIKACMDQVPAAERKLVTSHDAFNYFTARYGITVVGAVIPSQSTQAQPSAGDVAKLAAVVRRENVKAVFPESSINPELAKTLARETGAKADYVLYGDTLGPEGSSGDTYLKMEAANADAMVKGFTGEANRVRDQRPLIEAHGLAAGYRGGPVVLEEVTLTVGRGQRVGVLGPNGGGKTTLMRVVLGELAPRAGTLAVRGRCGTVPQTERSRLDYPVSALDVVLMGVLGRGPWWRRPGRADRADALGALERVGLRERARETFGELSGGQRQRVLVARALLQDADVVLFDEPFTGLDTPSAARLTELIDTLASEGRAVLVATHDVAQTLAWDAVLCLNCRQIACGAPADTLTEDALRATYGQALVRLPASAGSFAVVAHQHG